ncbi:hypothetical protein BBAD15_g6503 [Beauveria bassiana D1-5]|uniref:Uncharacterized protein n=1 Tax=Beauveria bassiana D1-5 TaxID=1245745 RepID=A0A0A2VKT2_BEABA|nr:hypothetical protein BBAD15_g6503 [Beauveria bassiana D1-5]
MAKFQTPVGVLIAFALLKAMAAPVADTTLATFTRAVAHDADAWELTLSNDTHHRIDVARKHLVNIEREALDLPLVDLFQAFGMALPKARPTTNSKAARSEAEDMREAAYLRGGTMYSNGKTTRSEAEEMREAAYLRGGTTYSNGKTTRSEAEEMREAAYLRGGTMYSNGKTTRSEVKGSTDSDDTVYGSLLNHDNLALGAIERVNVAHRVTGKPELTKEKTDAMSSNADNWVKGYWGSSMKHGTFWTTDQVHGEPNFIEGGQVNGYGFVQSTYHKRHCLANLRMMLAWHIAGDASKMTNDMNVHAIHCLEYLREREQSNADLREEPIDTIDYKGMGIH